MVLVIAWCAEQPHRVGELAVIPAAGAMQVLGRGVTEDEPRMRFFRPRPGKLESTEPLASPTLSRRQLEVRAGVDGIQITRVGQCPMRINGIACDAATLRPLVARSAATLPPGLIDAELFGNARNYQHAGMPERPGLIGQADGTSCCAVITTGIPASSRPSCGRRWR